MHRWHLADRTRALLLVWVFLCVALTLAACQQPADPNPEPESSPVARTRHVSEAALYRAETYGDTLDEKTQEVTPEEAALHEVAEPQPASTRYTLMVYMVGSNLESKNAAATLDLQEMLESGVDFNQTNIIVYAGGAKRWNSNIPLDCNSVLDLSRAPDDRIVAQTDAAVSMGAPDTLAAFINYGEKYYPAEHTALVFWDHGGGPLWGYGYDEVNNGDGLLLSELRDALEATPYAGGSRTFDFVGFDACLMGSMENIALWQDYAQYLVASEEVEPGAGWDYAFLSSLNETEDPAAIGASIVQSYADYYEAAASSLANPDVTLACYDLAKARELVQKLDELLDGMSGLIDAGQYADLSRARRATKAFGLPAAGSRAAGFDLIDLADFATKLQPLLPDESKGVREALGAMVASHAENIENASGVSLYVPGDNRELFETYSRLEDVAATGRATAKGGGQTAEDAYLSKSYRAFVDRLADEWMTVSSVDWTAEPVATEGGGMSLQLTDAQVDALASASYTLLSCSSPGDYEIHMADVSLDLDETGTLHVPADPAVIVTSTDTGSEVMGRFVQVEEANGKATYINSDMTLDAAGNFSYDNGAADEQFTVTVQFDEEREKVSIRSIDINDDTVGVSGKNTLDASRYSHVYQPMISGRPQFDASGAILPWDEWELYTSGGSFHTLEKGFGFAMRHISHYGGPWAAQIVLTDVNGDRHAYEPVYIREEAGERATDTIVRATVLGEMTFTRKGDHLELTSYEGEDWTVDIPTELEGMKVTEIGHYAFSNCKYLDVLTVPEGIESIGPSAFSGTGVYTISLPSSLRSVSPAAFAKMPYLEEFVVADECPAVTAIDGVLYSPDGTTLIAYPNKKGDTFAVPSGVETIGYGAFAETDVASVELPEGLKVIDRAAFFGCSKLQEVKLPESLTEIGAVAFGSNHGSEEIAPVEQIHIGSKVDYVGACAFSGLNLASIDVDEQNTRFTSREGMLLNVAGDTLLEVPLGVGPVVAVPEGVVNIDPKAFADDPFEYADFVLPASLLRLEPTCFPSYYDSEIGRRVYECTVHAPEGSAALEFAQEQGIVCDTNTDVASLQHEQVVVEQDGYDLTFVVYPDHAVLTDAEVGDDYNLAEYTLTIPDVVADVPVTTIRASYGIGTYHIETLVLPMSLEVIEEGSLQGFSELKQIKVKKGNTHFRVVDDSLFTRPDDTAMRGASVTLVACPRTKEGKLTIPKGVERLGKDSLSGCGVTSVELPASLLEIGASAFSSCENLEQVKFNSRLEVIEANAFKGCEKLRLDEPLPENLIAIGDGSFSGIARCEGFVLPEDLEQIGEGAFSDIASSDSSPTREANASVKDGVVTIGSYLTDWGDKYGPALKGLAFSRFEVAEDNEYFRGEGPLLLTKDGTRLVAVADGYEGAVHIPEGVREVDGNLFKYARGVTDLYLPDSVTRLSWPEYKDDPDYAVVNALTVHVSSGSFGHRFAQERGFSWVVE